MTHKQAQTEADLRAREINMRTNALIGRLNAVGLYGPVDYAREEYVISHYGALARADRVNITQMGALRLLDRLETTERALTAWQREYEGRRTQ